MPTPADVKALAFDPPGRWDAFPDAPIAKIIAAVSRFYAAQAEPETPDTVLWHAAHVLSKATGGNGGGNVQGGGQVVSHSVSLGGASKTFAVSQQAQQGDGGIDPLDGTTHYGAIALGLRNAVPTIDVG